MPPWLAFGELISPDGVRLRARAEAVREALAGRGGCPVDAVPLRVAVSVMHLGLAARLIAPAVAAAALGDLPRLGLEADGLWWQDQLGRPVPLSVPVADGNGKPPGVIDDLVAPLTEAAGALVPVSPRVLWGNVASAVSGAAGQIAGQRPGLAPAAWAAAGDLAGHPSLSQERSAPGPGFRRSSCCLIYQLSPGPARAICGDCVLGLAARVSPRSRGRSSHA
ncbi:MAG TPA: (2Fe-2S)-binding protein [Streptosporangiaceae bacterium]|nr:(2Fe-2S)-binding protein [Streptosporangiaceae bacterium]